ncbi:MAG: Kdo hydroxylase family protein [Gallionellaceae bacterium]|jgi:hypothetical protein|nr:Kdo hydroxylase family protein [Gallionellaceae bacterium]
MNTPTSPSIVDLPLRTWDDPEARALSGEALAALEQGQVLHFPQLSFPLSAEETALLDPALTDPKRKNISLSARGLAGTVAEGETRERLHATLARFRDQSGILLDALFPGYSATRHSPATSLRLHAIGTWHPSWRKDDRLLHVDAFPSRPLRGERILRVFNNINPHGVPRTWHAGGSFETTARHYLPALNKPWHPWLAGLMNTLGITKQRRTEYDHLMLQLHDNMKRDADYQREGDWVEVNFMPGHTWVCYSDQVPHAALSGQFMLEQTWHVPLAAMSHTELAPVRVLERLMGRPLLV